MLLRFAVYVLGNALILTNVFGFEVFDFQDAFGTAVALGPAKTGTLTPVMTRGPPKQLTRTVFQVISCRSPIL